MSIIIISSIFLFNFKIISTAYLNVESNYVKPQFERNNIVNKGVWVRNPKERFFEKGMIGDFIFRANSLDADKILNDNFDAFGDNDMQDSPGFSSYIERSKRSSHSNRKRFLRESLKECKGNKECIQKTLKVKANSEILPKLTPASVFNDYPYGVAILVDDNKLQDISNNIRKAKQSEDINPIVPLKNEDSQVIIEALHKNESKYENNTYSNEVTNNSILNPKRSMRNEYDSELFKKVEFIEEINDVGNTSSNKFDRGIFDRGENVWHQSMPISDSTDTVGPKYPKNKVINERGLVKVLSMLTKTFKKIMKQHNDIRKIHGKLHTINDEVNSNIVAMNKKLQVIEEKYAFIVAVSEKIKEVEANMYLKEEYLRNKNIEMAKNLLEFENQQKKFLTQQRQFYNIQKLMLSQNEKINIKQNLIAKTQSEISHRQNNFARILKKAKQIYLDNNKQIVNKLQTTSSKPVLYNDTEVYDKIIKTSTIEPVTESIKIKQTTSTIEPVTESIKINLFSIPALNKLVNQDTLILKEKDEQPVDDLVYKYYFNNTFIDNLMKSKILSSFMTTAENTEITRNAKNKRNKDKLDKTILLPINVDDKTENKGKLHRERRWIRHHSKTKSRRKARGKNDVEHKEISDSKPLRPKTSDTQTVTKLFAKDKSSPFIMMAKSFCNEIGQNTNDQMLNWCVEKALRRLRFLDTKMPPPLPVEPESLKSNNATKALPVVTRLTTQNLNNTSASSTDPVFAPVTIPSTTPLTTGPIIVNESTPTNLIYFPDNDELESNLKEFDLKPDTEGNVYYDGSLHASDLVGMADNDDGFSDIMPGLDSNSKVDVNPLTFDLQARRRAAVQRINANIMKRQRQRA